MSDNGQSLYITETEEFGKVILIKFSYDKDLVFRIKNELFPRKFIVEQKSWITPVVNIAKVLSIFPNASQSEGFKQEFISQKDVYFNNKKLKEIEYEVNSGPITLYKHQKQTINYLVNKKQAGLLSAMGTGKSFSLIYTYKALKEKGLVDKVLVLCPSSLTYNWYNEVLKTEEYIPVIIEGDKEKKISIIKERTGNFFITNFEATINHKKKVKGDSEYLDIEQELISFTKLHRCMLVIDESHRIKGRSNRVFTFLKKLTKNMEYRFISTGTLVANKPEDVWSQFHCINPSILGTSFHRDFAQKYCILGNRYSEYAIVGYKNLEQLKFVIEQNSIRHLKEEVLDLPEKNFKNYYVTMGTEQRKLYTELEDNILRVIENEEDITNITNNVFTLIEMASNPQLLSENFSYETEKLLELDKILEENIQDSGKKIVLWTNFIGNIKLFSNRYKKYGVREIYGDISNKDRQQAVIDFQTDDKIKLIICNPAAASVGLTLTASSTAVFFDRGFSYTLWAQSVDRIHRISQKSNVEIISLICRDTIDEGVDSSLSSKESVSDYLTNKNYTIGNKKEVLKKLIKRKTGLF